MKNSCVALLWLLGILGGSLFVVGAGTGQSWASGPLGEWPCDCEYYGEVPAQSPDVMDSQFERTGYDGDYDRAMWGSPENEFGNLPFRVVGYGPAEEPETPMETSFAAELVSVTQVMESEVPTCGILLRGLARSLDTCSSWLDATAGELDRLADTIEQQ